MQITTNNRISFSGLIPIKNHRGPLLKLDKNEEERISALRENIVQLECEIYNFSIYYTGRRLSSDEIDYYSDKMYKIETQLKYLRRLIKDIKTNRYRQQIAEEIK